MKYRDYNNKTIKKAITDISNITDEKAYKKLREVKQSIKDIKDGFTPIQKKSKIDFYKTLNSLADYYFENHTCKSIKADELIYKLHCREEEFAVKSIYLMTRKELLEFQKTLQKRHPKKKYVHKADMVEDKTKYLSNKTVNDILRLCSRVIKYAIKNEEYTGDNLFNTIDHLKEDNITLKQMTDKEIETLLSAIKNAKSKRYDHIINFKLAYLYAQLAITTGARLQTILHIKVEDVNFQDKEINLYNFKTEKDYFGHIVNDEVENTLRDIIDNYCTNPSDYIFRNQKTGKKYHRYPLLVKEKLDELINKDRNEKNKITIRDLRNVFATRLINKGMNLSYIQNLLDHTTPNMTLRYARMLDKTGGKELKKMFEGVSL
jgi:site-specific recombinase XerD